MISPTRFLGKIERHIARVEGSVRLYARVSYMNVVNDRRKFEGKPPLYDERDYKTAIQEEVPRNTP